MISDLVEPHPFPLLMQFCSRHLFVSHFPSYAANPQQVNHLGSRLWATLRLLGLELVPNRSRRLNLGPRAGAPPWFFVSVASNGFSLGSKSFVCNTCVG